MSPLFSFAVSDQVLLWATNVLIHTTVLAAMSLLIALLFRKVAVTRYWILCLGMLLVLGSPLISAFIQSRGNSFLTLALPVEEPTDVAATTPTLPIVAGKPAPERSFDLDQPIESASIGRLEMEQPFDQRVPTPDEMPTVAVNETVVTPSPIVTEPVAKARSASEWLRVILTSALVVWAVGTTLLLVRVSLGWTRMARILKQAQPVENPELRQAFEQACAAVGHTRDVEPKFVVSDSVSGPIAAGIFGGTVVLPTHLVDQVDAANLANVLVHEVAHVARRDQIVVLIQNLVAALYWPHPLVKMLNRELAKAREEVCDNFVLAGIEAPAYSRTLLSLAELVQQPEAMPGSVGFFTDRWKLEHRVAGLLDTRRDRKTFLSKRSWMCLATTTVLLALMTCVSTITFATAPLVGVANASDDENDSPAADDLTLISGVVSDPDGNPVSGARVVALRHVWSRHFSKTDRELVAETTSDEKGKYELQLPSTSQKFSDEDNLGVSRTSILAIHRNFGPEEKTGPLSEKTVNLQLAKATVPLLGRVLDLEGKPVVGARVKLQQIEKPNVAFGNTDAVAKWAELAKKNPTSNSVNGMEVASATEAPAPVVHFYPVGSRLSGVELLNIETTTDTDGQFRINDIGDDRLAILRVDGADVASTMFQVVARKMAAVNTPDMGGLFRMVKTFGNEPVVVAEPSRIIRGVVRDRESGDPIPGVTVARHSYDPQKENNVDGILSTITDAQGRYELTGLPRVASAEKRTLMLGIEPPRGDPETDRAYFRSSHRVPTAAGFEPIEFDISLTRGVWASGQVTSAKTGQSVPSIVGYHPFIDNQYAKDHEAFTAGSLSIGNHEMFATDENGNYHVPALRGHGVLRVIAGKSSEYEIVTLPGTEIRDRGSAGYSVGRIADQKIYHTMSPGNAVVELNIAKDAKQSQVNVELQHLDTLVLKVLNPDGSAASGFRVAGRRDFRSPLKTGNYWQWKTVQDSTVDVMLSRKGKLDRPVMLFNRKQSLGAVVWPDEINLKNLSTLEVRLQPCATIVGKVLNPGKKKSGHASIQAGIGGIEDEAFKRFEYPMIGLEVLGESGAFEFVVPPSDHCSLILNGRETLLEEESLAPGETLNLGTIDAKANPKTWPKPIRTLSSVAQPTSKPVGVVRATSPMSPSGAVRKQNKIPVAAAPTANGLKVQVILPNGKPAAGAHVAVTGDDAETWEQTVVLETMTDTNGVCWLDEKTWPKDKSRENTRFLLARSDGYGIGWRKLAGNHQNQAERKTIEIKLLEQGIIEGKLVDIEGQPAVGETLQINRVKSREANAKNISSMFGINSDRMLGLDWDQNSTSPQAWLPSVITDDDGRFKLTGVPIGYGVFVSVVNSKKFPPQGFAINAGQRSRDDDHYRSKARIYKPGEEAVVVLSPGKVFVGVVTFEDTGEPVPDAKVSIWASQSEFGTMSSIEGHTDAEGRYRMLPKPGIRFGVAAYPPSGVPYMARETERLTWENGDSTREVDIKLPRVVLVRGRVLEEGTDLPVEGATITYRPGGKRKKVPKNTVTGWRDSQTSDVKGQFYFRRSTRPRNFACAESRG